MELPIEKEALTQVLEQTEKRIQYSSQKLSMDEKGSKKIFALMTKVRKCILEQNLKLFEDEDKNEHSSYEGELRSEGCASLFNKAIAQVAKTPTSYSELLKRMLLQESNILLREQQSQYYLRPHQIHALYHVHHAIHVQGKKKILVQMATGTGKTVLFSYFPELLDRKGKILVLSHRDNLFTQTAKKLQEIHPEKSIQIEANVKKNDGNFDMLVGSAMTLGRKNMSAAQRTDMELEQVYEQDSEVVYTRDDGEYVERLKKLDPKEFSMIIIDEAHHSTANSYQRILDYFYAANPDIIVAGVTATPMRSDDAQLENVYEVLAYSLTLRESIERNILSEIECFRINTGVSLDHIPTGRGDFDAEALSLSINTPERNALIISKMQEYGRRADGTLKRSMIFASSVAHSRQLELLARENGWRGTHIDAETPPEERDRALLQLKHGEIDFITNFGVFTEGTDIEELEQVVLARPTKSPILYEQMIGRGTRRIEGIKEMMTLLDFVDATKFHKVMDVSKLFGQSVPLENGPVIKRLQEREEEQMKKLVSCTIHSGQEQEDDQRYMLFQSIPELKKSEINFVGDHEYARVYVSEGRFIELVRAPVMNAWKCYFKHLGNIPGYCDDEGEKLYGNIQDAIADISHVLQTHFSNDKFLWNRYLHTIIDNEAPTVKQVKSLSTKLKNKEYCAELLRHYPHLSYTIPQLKKAIAGYTKEFAPEPEVKQNREGQYYTLQVFTKSFQERLLSMGFTKALAMQLIGFVKEKARQEAEERKNSIIEELLREEEKKKRIRDIACHSIAIERSRDFHRDVDLDSLEVEELDALVAKIHTANYFSDQEFRALLHEIRISGYGSQLSQSMIEFTKRFHEEKFTTREELALYREELYYLNHERTYNLRVQRLQQNYATAIEVYNRNWPRHSIHLVELEAYSDAHNSTLSTLEERFRTHDLATDDDYREFQEMVHAAEKAGVLQPQEAFAYQQEIEGVRSFDQGVPKKVLLTRSRVREVKEYIRMLEKHAQTVLTPNFRNYAYRVLRTAEDNGCIPSEEVKNAGVQIYAKNATYVQVHQIFSKAFDALKDAGLSYLVQQKK